MLRIDNASCFISGHNATEQTLHYPNLSGSDTTKRVCRACRFEKCVAAGMNPMAIQAEVTSYEGEQLRKRIAASRESFDSVMLFNMEEKVNQVIGRLTMVEAKIDGIHNNGMPMGFKDTRGLRSVLEAKVIFDSMKIPSMSYTPVKYSKHTGL